MQVDSISSLEIMRFQHDLCWGRMLAFQGDAHSFNPLAIEMIVRFRFSTGIQFRKSDCLDLGCMYG